MKKLNHRNLIKLHDYILEEEKLYIILEFAEGGSLSQVLKQFKEGFPEHLVQKIIYQVSLFSIKIKNPIQRTSQGHEINVFVISRQMSKNVEIKSVLV
jgi:serine/threonine protein kinase